MQFARYVAILLLTCLAVYGALMGASYVLFPARDSVIDTLQASRSIYGTEPKYLIFSLHALDRPGRRVIALGASNVREGLRPPLLSARLHLPVDNLAIGAADMHETEEVVDAAYAHVPQSSWRDITFVIGVWYGFLVPTSRAWPDGVTDLDNEYDRYGLYARKGGAAVARLPQALQEPAEVLLRPVVLVAGAYDRYVVPLRDGLRAALLRLAGERPADVTVPDKETFNLTQSQRQIALEFWRKYMGEPGADNASAYRALTSLAQRISGRGSRLIILDLPIPAWHRDALPYDALYRARSRPYFEALTRLPGVRYVSLRDGFRDDQFYDSVHPRPSTAALWADRLSAALRDKAR